MKKNFPRILENITTPAIKRSFQTGVVAKVSGTTITVGFASNFHLDKVNNVQGHDVVERAFKKVFGQVVKLECELSKVNIAPAYKEKKEEDSKASKIVEEAIEEVDWESI